MADDISSVRVQQKGLKLKSIIFSSLVALSLLGCSSPQSVATLQGQGHRKVYSAPFDAVWRAAVDAAQQGDLEILNADRPNGYIAARRGIRMETFGENVGVWIKRVAPDQTEVAVVSRQAGPPVLWLKNWENEILRAISANLTRDPGYSERVTDPAGADLRPDSPALRNQENRREEELRREKGAQETL